MKKIFALVLALAMVFACAAIASAEDLITVGFAQNGHESDWRVANTQNYNDVLTEENGFDLTLIDCENDNAKQIEAVRNFIQQEVDYILIAPETNVGWDVVLQEAQDAGIPVIIVDRQVDADPSMYTAFIGTNSYDEGVTAANWLDEYMGQKGIEEAKILVIEGSNGASAQIGRTEGFNSVADTKDNWTILASQDGNFTQAEGQEVMESFLKNPDYAGFNVLVCQNDNEAYGAMDAMDAAGVTYGVDGDVTIISYDATKEGLTRTLDGRITCDVECNPLQAEAVMALIQQIEAEEDFELVTYVEDKAFVAPGIESALATTMTDEVLAGRAY